MTPLTCLTHIPQNSYTKKYGPPQILFREKCDPPQKSYIEICDPPPKNWPPIQANKQHCLSTFSVN